jgi:RNA polymerase sigma-70 factor (ECF subfamily)
MPDSGTRAGLDELLGALRPKLHRYCARMTGSVIDGEDVVQDVMAKALAAFPEHVPADHREAWLLRVAHNAAIDFLRRRVHRDAGRSDEDPDMIAEPAGEADRRVAAAAALRTFMRLPVAQRSSVILMDVIGYSLEEIGGVLGVSVPAVKASLHRGRARLRELAAEPQDRPWPPLGEPERSLLAAYVDRFNARDFDAVRDMLAEEVRLELVARARLAGRAEVGRYFGNYAANHDWRLAAGLVEGRPAALVLDARAGAAPPLYFVLLAWRHGELDAIRDFRYARYAMGDAAFSFLAPAGATSLR